MVVQSVMDTNRSIEIEYANPVKSVNVSRAWQIVDVITLAFSTNPMARWIYPNPQEYLQFFANFVRLYAGKSFQMGSAFYIQNFAAASLWLPPNVQPDEQGLASLFLSTVSAEKRRNLFAVVEEISKYRPSEPHWYLPLIGTDPLKQGRGHGSALLSHALNVSDNDGRSAYLETSNPKAIPLYEKFGFEKLGVIQIGSSPPIFPMLRKPFRLFGTLNN